VRSLCADPAWFSDSVTLNMESKELIEVTQGRWFVEAPELSRLTGAEAEHVKALLSRAEDVARLAYGRSTTTRKRQFVIIGTTNEDTYLQDTTGNRRFLPIKTGTIDVDGLIEARDQIFAEAVQRYRQGETNELPGDVLDEARREQEARQFENEYIDQLEDLLRDKTGSISMSVLYSVLEIPPARRRGASRFIKSAMQSLGWTLHDRSWIKGSPHRKWKALGTVLTEASPDLKVMPSQ
jgi:predicted P-loop ATPase